MVFGPGDLCDSPSKSFARSHLNAIAPHLQQQEGSVLTSCWLPGADVRQPVAVRRIGAMTNSADVRAKATRAVKWSYIGTFLPQLVQPLATIILARLLLPEDYGIVAMGSAILSLVQVFQSLGVSEAIIQYPKEKIDDASNVAFWANCAAAALLVAGLEILAPHIAAFFHDPRLTAVIRVQSLGLLVVAAGSVQSARSAPGIRVQDHCWRVSRTVASFVGGNGPLGCVWVSVLVARDWLSRKFVDEHYNALGVFRLEAPIFIRSSGRWCAALLRWICARGTVAGVGSGGGRQRGGGTRFRDGGSGGICFRL